MRVFILIALWLLFIGNVQGQGQYNDKGIYTIDRKYENWGTLFFLDEKIIRQYNYIPRDYLKRLFINSQALDSSRLSLKTFISLNDKMGRIYGTSSIQLKTSSEFGADYDNSIYEIDFEKESIKKIATYRNTPLMPGDNFYYTKEDDNDSILYKIDPSTGYRSIFTKDLPYVLDTCNFCTGAHIFNFLELGNMWQLSDTTFIMQFADCSADCSNYRYLLYNHQTKNYKKISRYDSLRQKGIELDKINNHYESNFLWLDIKMKDISEKYLYVRESIIMKDRIENEYIIDASANLITPAVQKHHFSPSYNYQGGKVVSIMAHTVLDNGKKVFVPYKFTLPLERSFYRLYNDQKILKEDLNQFGEYELSILKNFIFAKHNYGFDTDFYQAYFNLFKFYNDEKERNSRTKDVNSLLTKGDKHNLNIITKALKKVRDQ